MEKYEINEQLAKEAKNSYSFTDYVSGSQTNEYNIYLKRFETAVEELKQRYPDNYEKYKEDVEYWSNRYSQKLAQAINRHNKITAYCPSIMITGGANFPTRKKEKQNSMEEKFWSECGELFDTKNRYYDKIDTILSNKVIYSNDELAIEKLKEKLEGLKEYQEYMKSANAYFKKNGTMVGYADLTDEEALKFDASILKYSYDRKAYETYQLQNNLGAIKQTTERIEQLEKMKSSATEYEKIDGIDIVENKQLMRIQILFDGKPDEQTRQVLKNNGFKWAPNEKAWQRQLTTNGIRATKQVIANLKAEVKK